MANVQLYLAYKIRASHKLQNNLLFKRKLKKKGKSNYLFVCYKNGKNDFESTHYFFHLLNILYVCNRICVRVV